ncbi:MAG: hypothetical protein ACHP7D_02470 [Lysobacterales bacterium]|jgi:hypothetical protein
MLHGSFRTFRLRHPLARAAVGVVGVIAALVLVAVGAVALVALAVVGGALLLVNAWRRRSSASAPNGATATATPAGVIEGEFRVVSTDPPERSTAAP